MQLRLILFPYILLIVIVRHFVTMHRCIVTHYYATDCRRTSDRLFCGKCRVDVDMKKGFIKNVLAVIVVLVIVFLSQQPNFREYGKDLYDQAVAQGQSWWHGAYSYVEQNVFSKIGGEVEKKKEAIQEELQQEKNKISENIWQKIKNYFADIFSKATGVNVQ